MKNQNRARYKCIHGLVCAVLLFCISGFAHGNGLAWEVSSDKAKGKAYLVGAVHLANDSYYPLQKEVLAAFEASDVLLVEMDEEASTPHEKLAIFERYAFYPKGESFRQHLSSELVAEINDVLASIGMSKVAHVFDRYRPGLLAITLAALRAQALGYSAEKGIDAYFLSKARNRKAIEEIESFELQMQLLGGIEVSEKLFSDVLVDDAQFKQDWLALETAWKQGDEEQLFKLAISDVLTEAPELASHYERLFFARNETMAKATEQCMSTRICFIVVGAGHLVGARSVTDLLQQRGYQVKRIP